MAYMQKNSRLNWISPDICIFNIAQIISYNVVESIPNMWWRIENQAPLLTLGLFANATLAFSPSSK